MPLLLDFPDEVLACIAVRLPDLKSVTTFAQLCTRCGVCIAAPDVQRKLKSRLLYTKRMFVLPSTVFIQSSNGHWKAVGLNICCYIWPNTGVLVSPCFRKTSMFHDKGDVSHLSGTSDILQIFNEEGHLYMTRTTQHPLGSCSMYTKVAEHAKPLESSDFETVGAVVNGSVWLHQNAFHIGSNVNKAYASTCGESYSLFHEDFNGDFWVSGDNRGGHLGLDPSVQFVSVPILHPELNLFNPTKIVNKFCVVLLRASDRNWYGWSSIADMELPFFHNDSREIQPVPLLDGALSVDLDDARRHCAVMFEGFPGLYGIGYHTKPGTGRHPGDPFERLEFPGEPKSFGCTTEHVYVLTDRNQVWRFPSKKANLTDNSIGELMEIVW